MDYSKILSSCVQQLKPSGIRKFFDLANAMEGVISLGVGEPDFRTPYAIRRAGIQSLEKGYTWYTANAGLAELREEIARYLHRRFDLNYESSQVLVTVGGSEAIDLCTRALINPGDEVLIPEPCFVAYDPIARLVGGVPVPLATRAEDQFKLTPEALRAAITPKTKMLVFPFPNNPTGAIMNRQDLEGIAEVLRETDIIVLSDEIYAELTYEGRHVSIASLPGMKERTVVVNGFSKAYAMTGWRLGYAVGPKEIMAQMLKLHQFAIMCAPTTSQYAAIEAMRSCDDEIQRMAIQFGMRRGLLVNSLNKMGLTCFDPQGAFYVFPSIKITGMTSEDFCEGLLRSQKVAVIPGSAFGESGEGYVRISYSYSVEHLVEALRRIETYLGELGVLPKE
ncbi:aminotransferase class I/II-fold pyridoxal phosphate-dependent enzyme [Angelakisella massiliensis]|uniref:aminotransferase class I/II-fold pyridoxal phosphate-dependent enzyme n=1 Tax=Angelakisella massiliensis TaxID=1871018 RepID=UPI0008F839AF|nr:aminotransferase class I/II-fold pyridoxal phosphate-dependent enzyme [Angelakisella massiliensis]